MPDIPVPELATCADPAVQHVRLRSGGVHQRGGDWLVSDPDDMAAALSLPSLSVAPPATGGGTPAGAARQLQRRMARFTDAPAHAHRRAQVERLLPDPVGLDEAAGDVAARWLERRTGPVDIMPLARSLPVTVLARALGVPGEDLGPVTAAIEQLSAALAPSPTSSPTRSTGDLAAEQLTARLAPVGPWDAEQVAAAAGILFQARDATAALIGASLLVDAGDEATPAARVDAALRRHAPVQCTRRVPTTDVEVGGVVVPRHAAMWFILAAAEQGPPAPPATFGTGPHACPGSAHATAMAEGVLTAVHRHGWRPVPGQPIHYEARPNLRMPATVLLERPR